jgi:hypothetical protein
MLLGKNGKWMWLTSRATALFELIERCPSIILSRHVVVTAFDSSPLELRESELESGWKYFGKSALSPRVTHTNQIPCDNFDEWYLFSATPNKEIDQVFINYCGFRLTAGHTGIQQLEGIPEESQFWEQLNIVQPYAYVAGGDNLVFVTTDDALFEQVMIAVQNVEFEVGTACDAKSATGPS